MGKDKLSKLWNGQNFMGCDGAARYGALRISELVGFIHRAVPYAYETLLLGWKTVFLPSTSCHVVDVQLQYSTLAVTVTLNLTGKLSKKNNRQ
jgi:hypothetical protein